MCLTDDTKNTEGNGSNWGKENGKGDELEREMNRVYLLCIFFGSVCVCVFVCV